MGRKFIVPIPASNVSFKKAPKGEERYIYHIIKRYRNKNGTPTNQEKIIGKEYLKKPGYMLANENYFSYYKNQNDIEVLNEMQVRKAGHLVLLSMISKNIKLTKVLKEIFGDKYKELLLGAMYMVCEGKVMMNVDFFLEESIAYNKLKLSSQLISQLFQSISDEEILKFFKSWSKEVLKEKEAVAYDVTSISTYSNHEISEYGYNRDREYLPQINFGLMYGALSQLPIAYSLYSGSINDITFFPYMMKLAKEIDVEKVFYMLDRGFISKSNLEFMNDHKIEFVAAAPKNERIYREQLQQVIQEIQHPKYRLQGTTLNGLKTFMDINGIKYSLFIYYSKENAALEENRLFDHIDSLEIELADELKPIRLSRYSKYYEIESKKQSVITSYKRDYDKIAGACELLGMFCLLSTKTDITAQEALELYEKRDEIEKIYDISRNQLEGKRMLTHSLKTTTGKLFIHYLALILWSDLSRKFKASNIKLEKTVERMLMQMRKISVLDYGKVKTLQQPLTRKQKDILQAFDFDESDFTSNVLKNIL